VCAWREARVLLNDNAIVAGVPIRHIQGQIRDLAGLSDGRSLEFEGVVAIDSLVVADQQVTGLVAPLSVAGGRVVLPDIRAVVMGGGLRGQLEMGLSETPEFKGWAELEGADLRRFAQTQGGRQEYSGRVSGRVELAGVGVDARRLNGSGHAHLADGDLGKLPWFLRLISPLNLSRERRSAFDSADLSFVVKDGECVLEPIKITGNTISLKGSGTLKPPGEVDLEFKTLYGRDERFHVPGLSDLTREASGQMLLITAKGPLASPAVGIDVLPGPTRGATEVLRRLGMPGRDATKPRGVRR
jgi:hypothetical protein